MSTRRKQIPHARWIELIREQETSGISLEEFCRERDLGIHSFRHHQGILRREKDCGSGFVEVGAPPRSSGLRLCGEGWTLELGRDFDVDTFRRFLSVAAR